MASATSCMALDKIRVTIEKEMDDIPGEEEGIFEELAGLLSKVEKMVKHYKCELKA